MSSDWLECSGDGWELVFRHPPTDSAGRAVTVARRGEGDVRGIHVTAENHDEIYFEVTRWDAMTAVEIYRVMQERLPGMYPGIEFDELKASTIGQSGSFRWPGQVREIHFIELAEATYRIILRPIGLVNHDILATVEIGQK